MKRMITMLFAGTASLSILLTACGEQPAAAAGAEAPETAKAPAYGGFENQVKWGEHLVLISGCNDCHTPKKMGPNGMEPDMSLMLSGHPANMPPPPLDLKEAAAKGLAASQTLTGWVGPWGISYAANITSDSTGIGAWTEAQFMKAVKEGKYRGLDNTRPLLPPMPWQNFAFFSDDEIKAMFAYLKSTPPVHNVVPEAVLNMPPAAAK
ncbi:diheme cytochrome c-553 [Panacibacter sp. DH6]|uniref:Diheme cytochrome c-553 n=1 Tax=Panacibacter microcysteis TaxID=2793269 RepID=A0A931E0A6_9BACT|nr:diheme cytochrome c-553 [Panacibacter microcysteis]MBG9375090.1 diheme cytochrome c-553 [Panacibacter microcysteis]